MTVSELLNGLQQGEVHVWTTDLSPHASLAARAFLPDHERMRAERFLLPHVQAQYVGSRMLLRRALSAYAGGQPVHWLFGAEPAGRPVALNLPAEGHLLRFSLSHSADLAVCALAWGGELGIDVETAAPEGAEDDCEDAFTQRERANLQRDRQCSRPSRFLEYWTIKEAFLKAHGSGLAGGMNRVEVTLPVEGGLGVCFDGAELDASKWQIWLQEPTGGGRCAIVRRSVDGAGPLPHLYIMNSDNGSACTTWRLISAGAGAARPEI